MSGNLEIWKSGKVKNNMINPDDLKSLLLDFDNNIDFIKEIFHDFFDEVNNTLHELKSAITNGQHDVVVNLVYRLKGTASYLRCHSIVDIFNSIKHLVNTYLNQNSSHNLSVYLLLLHDSLQTQLSQLQKYVCDTF